MNNQVLMKRPEPTFFDRLSGCRLGKQITHAPSMQNHVFPGWWVVLIPNGTKVVRKDASEEEFLCPVMIGHTISSVYTLFLFER